MFNYSAWVKDTNPATLEEYYTKALEKAGFNILEYVEHHFKPQGFTSLYLLSESHFAIHTFPEEGKSYIELSSCIDEPYNKFKEIINA